MIKVLAVTHSNLACKIWSREENIGCSRFKHKLIMKNMTLLLKG